MNLRGRLRRKAPFATAVVVGDSMAPAYRAGDWILIRRTRRVRPDQVIAARDPRDPERIVIKRLVRRTAEGWWLLGDNPAHSTDSRTFGAVPTESVLGTVLFRYHRSADHDR